MKRNALPLKFILVSAGLFFCLASFAQEKKYYKGNLHTHSYWSDGDEFPEMIMDWYKKRKYDFVALSDHNIIAEGEKWKTLPKDSIYQVGFQEYLEEYGENWVEYKKDSAGIHVKLKTLEEFRPLFEEEEEFMIFKAEEVTAYLENKAVHMGAINIQEVIQPKGGNTIVELIQNNIDAIREQSERTGELILQHLNHPNFTYAIKPEDIIKLDGERFFEVFNGHPYVNNYGDSIHNSTERMWDQVNIAYINTGKPIMYGLATDDSHHYHKFGSKYSNAGRGWVMVNAERLHPHDLIESMEAGDFYSTTGVELEDVNFENNRLSVDIKEEKGVKYKIQFIGAWKNNSRSEVLKTVYATKADFKLPKGFLFLRAKITSNKPKKNPYKKGDLEVAWTQPFLPKKPLESLETAVIPAPKESNFSGEKLCIENLTFFSKIPELEDLFMVLREEFFTLTGKEIQSAEEEKSAALFIKIDQNLSEEEYEIETGEKITISGGSHDAVAMASITLLQLLQDENSLCWPKGKIKDSPEFNFRAVMIDLARRKHDIETIKRVIMLCRWYKINYLQLHLTDEHAFTFPSKAYPQLSTEGWAYSEEELKDLIAFADARGVEIIPELEVPGHAGELVEQMPKVFAFKDPDVHPYTVHMGRERVYEVLDTLIGEISEIFSSSEYIHIGGDEANFTNMEKDPEIQEFLQQNNLEDMEELFWCFINKMNASVKKHGKKTIVWEGFSKEGNAVIDKDIVVMAWETKYQLPQDILEAGYKTVNVSWKPLYVVNQRKWSPEEIYNWNIFRWENWVPSIPSYNPIQLDPHPGLIGTAMASWDQPAYTEISSLRKRIPAMVEEAWNHNKKAPFEDFEERLSLQDKKFSKYLSPVKIEVEGGSYPEIKDGHQDEQTWFDDKATIYLTSCPDFNLRYSRDGSAVTTNSPEFKDSIVLKKSTEIRYRAYKDEEPVGAEMLEFFELNPLKVKMDGDFTMPPEERWNTPELHLIRFENEVSLQFSAKRKGEIKYVTGDKELNAEAETYNSPLKITNDTFVKAGLFQEGKQVGKTWQQHFKKSKTY